MAAKFRWDWSAWAIEERRLVDLAIEKAGQRLKELKGQLPPAKAGGLPLPPIDG